MTTVVNIKDAFPYPTIDPIIGQAGWETIKPMHEFLNANSASIVSYLGNGRIGLLFLTVLPSVFNTLSAVPFEPPEKSGLTVYYLPGATQHQIRDHDLHAGHYHHANNPII